MLARCTWKVGREPSTLTDRPKQQALCAEHTAFHHDPGTPSEFRHPLMSAGSGEVGASVPRKGQHCLGAEQDPRSQLLSPHPVPARLPPQVMKLESGQGTVREARSLSIDPSPRCLLVATVPENIFQEAHRLPGSPPHSVPLPSSILGWGARKASLQLGIPGRWRWKSSHSKLHLRQTCVLPAMLGPGKGANSPPALCSLLLPGFGGKTASCSVKLKGTSWRNSPCLGSSATTQGSAACPPMPFGLGRFPRTLSRVQTFRAWTWRRGGRPFLTVITASL